MSDNMDSRTPSTEAARSPDSFPGVPMLVDLDRYRRPGARLVPATCRMCGGTGTIDVAGRALAFMAPQERCPACHGKATVRTEVRP